MLDNKKNILVFVDWFLPGYRAGGILRTIANLIDNLSEIYNFYVITRDRDYMSERQYQNISAGEWNLISSSLRVFYLKPSQINIKFISDIVKNTDFDLAFINGVYSFYFSIFPVWLMRRLKRPVVLSARGMLSKHTFSRKKLKKRVFIYLAKTINFYSNLCFHATSQIERQEILSFFPKARVILIPNPTRNIDNFPYLSRTKEQGQLRLVSIARISQEKNTLFALEVLKDINKGEVIFDLFGTIYDSNYWAECKRLISQMHPNVKVNYKGEVHTNKVLDTFSQYHFSFMPSMGENFGHSIFESLAAGTPVIISSNTPWRDLQYLGIGWDLDLHNKRQFQEVIEACLQMSDKEYESVSRNAYFYVREKINRKQILQEYIKMFNYCIEHV